MSKLLLIILIFTTNAFAAKRPPTWRHLTNGNFLQGGKAKSLLSLADFRISSSQQARTERLVLDWSGKQVGYYHIHFDRKDNRKIYLSFARTLNASFVNHTVRDKIKNSLFVKNMSMDFDRLDLSHNFVIELKETVQVKIIDFPGTQKNPARFVLDLVGKL